MAPLRLANYRPGGPETPHDRLEPLVIPRASETVPARKAYPQRLLPRP